MNKTYFFESGLPRSGTTTLSAVMNQNPQIHSGPLSPVFESMLAMENYLKMSEQANAFPKPDSFHTMISGLIDGYYSDIAKPYVIDKCRAWTGQIPRIKHYLTDHPKIIVTVRNPLEILASFISMIHRNHNQISFIDRNLIKEGLKATDENRCDFLMRPGGVVYESLAGLINAMENYRECIHLVEYDDLTSNPEQTLREVYNFLSLDYFNHDFNNLTNQYRENDNIVYGLNDMHKVRKEIGKISKKYDEVLTENIIEKYNELEFWKQ
jgi:sulfotransferase